MIISIVYNLSFLIFYIFGFFFDLFAKTLSCQKVYTLSIYICKLFFVVVCVTISRIYYFVLHFSFVASSLLLFFCSLRLNIILYMYILKAYVNIKKMMKKFQTAMNTRKYCTLSTNSFTLSPFFIRILYFIRNIFDYKCR